MNMKKALLWLCVLLAVISCFLGVTSRFTHAQDSSGPDQTVLAKLEQILGNQKTILDDLAAMKEELRIIKIRITQQQ